MAHTSDVATTVPSPPKEVQLTQSWDLSGRGTTRAEHAPGIPTQSHTSPSVLVAAECTFTRLLDPRRAHPSLLYRPGAKSWNKCQILPKRFLWEQILVIRQLCACLPKRVPWHRATAGRILVIRQLGVCLIARMRPGVAPGAANQSPDHRFHFLLSLREGNCKLILNYLGYNKDSHQMARVNSLCSTPLRAWRRGPSRRRWQTPPTSEVFAVRV